MVPLSPGPGTPPVSPAPTLVQRLRLKIPRTLQTEPVLSRLVSDHGLSVNFRGALLGSSGQHDGWFDLLLEGPEAAIEAGLAYLSDQGVEIWLDSPFGDW
jgi:hypothetical protein